MLKVAFLIKKGHTLKDASLIEKDAHSKFAFLIEKGAPDFGFRPFEHAHVKGERARGWGKNCLGENISDSLKTHR